MSLSSNFPTSKPSLNLDFANVGALDPRITFTRSSSATYTNSLGLVATAATNVARFDYDPTTLAARGLLIEEQRTNLALYSEDFSNAAWSTFQASALANVAASPNGTITADQISSTAGPYGVSFQSLIVTIGVTYTFSVYVKAGTSTSAIIGITDTTDYFVVANLSTGTITTPTAGSSATIQPAGNGWYRITVTRTSGSIYNNGFVGPFVAAGSILVWGAQMEAGSFATSYIPTVSSTVTRSADVASVNTLSPWFNATEGTIFAEYSFYGADALYNNPVVMITNGTEDNYEAILGYNPAYGWIQSGGVTSCGLSSGGSTTINTNYKAAFAFKVNDFAFSLNGGAAVTDASGTLPTHEHNRE